MQKDHFSKVIFTCLALLASSRLSSNAFTAFEMMEVTDCVWALKLLRCNVGEMEEREGVKGGGWREGVRKEGMREGEGEREATEKTNERLYVNGKHLNTCQL